jgi:uncharacterized membrane protein YgcG
VAIQTGYGMEHIIPDAIAKRITERTLKPNFQQGEFYKGLNEATNLIISLASGEYQADPQASSGEGEGPSLLTIVIIVMVLVFVMSRFKGGGGKAAVACARSAALCWVRALLAPSVPEAVCLGAEAALAAAEAVVSADLGAALSAAAVLVVAGRRACDQPMILALLLLQKV